MLTGLGVGVDPVHGSQQTRSCVFCSLCDLNGTHPNDSVVKSGLFLAGT